MSVKGSRCEAAFFCGVQFKNDYVTMWDYISFLILFRKGDKALSLQRCRPIRRRQERPRINRSR